MDARTSGRRLLASSAGWSRRAPLGDVVIRNRWTADGGPTAPPSRLRAPDQAAVVAARDDADALLAGPTSLGVLDRAVDRVVAGEGVGAALGAQLLLTGLAVRAGTARTVEDQPAASVARPGLPGT